MPSVDAWDCGDREIPPARNTDTDWEAGGGNFMVEQAMELNQRIPFTYVLDSSSLCLTIILGKLVA